jgi:RnfABCDGE-type electron transport complex G subunit
MPKPVHYAVVLFLITAACIGGINFVYAIAKDNIEKSKFEDKMRSIRVAFGLDAADAKTEIIPVRVKDGDREVEVYVLKGKGYAVVSKAHGYSSDIETAVAVSEDCGKILGISVISQAETPGFGAEMMNPPVTRTWFGGVKPGAEKMKIPRYQAGYFDLPSAALNNYTNVKQLDKDTPVDAISGATISSNALMNAVKGGLAKLKALKTEVEKALAEKK